MRRQSLRGGAERDRPDKQEEFYRSCNPDSLLLNRVRTCSLKASGPGCFSMNRFIASQRRKKEVILCYDYINKTFESRTPQTGIGHNVFPHFLINSRGMGQEWGAHGGKTWKFTACYASFSVHVDNTRFPCTVRQICFLFFTISKK